MYILYNTAVRIIRLIMFESVLKPRWLNQVTGNLGQTSIKLSGLDHVRRKKLNMEVQRCQHVFFMSHSL